MTSLDYRLVDFDNHYYEPEDAFTRHGDNEVQRFVRWVSDGKKRRLLFGNVVAAAIPNPTFNPIGKPGSFHARLKELAEHGDGRNVHPMEKFGELEPLPDSTATAPHDSGRWTSRASNAPCSSPPSVWASTASTPTRAHDLQDLPRVQPVARRRLGFAHAERIYGAPFIPMLDPQLACAELDAVLARDAKVVVMRPGPAGGRSPADPAWDPYWSRIEEAGVVAAYHACPMPDEYATSFATMWQRHASTTRCTRTTSIGVQPPPADARDLPGARARQPVRTVPQRAGGVGGTRVGLGRLLPLHARPLRRAARSPRGGVRPDRRGSALRHLQAAHLVSPFPEDDITHWSTPSVRNGCSSVRLAAPRGHSPADRLPGPLEKLDAESVRRIMRDNGLGLLT